MEEGARRGASTRDEVQALLARLRESRPVVRFRSFGLEAADRGSVRSEVHSVGPLTVQVFHRSAATFIVLVDLTDAPAAHAGDVIPISISGGDPELVLAPVVERGPYRSAEVEVRVDPESWDVHVVDDWLVADALVEVDPEPIESSVPLANTAGRRAWQEIAARLPEGDSARRGIERGLGAGGAEPIEPDLPGHEESLYWNTSFADRPDLTASDPVQRGTIEAGTELRLRTTLEAIRVAGVSIGLSARQVLGRSVTVAVRADGVGIRQTGVTGDFAPRWTSDARVVERRGLAEPFEIDCQFLVEGPVGLELDLIVDGNPVVHQSIDLHVGARPQEQVQRREGSVLEPDPPGSTLIDRGALVAVESAAVSMRFVGRAIETTFDQTDTMESEVHDSAAAIQQLVAGARNALAALAERYPNDDGFELGDAADEALLLFAECGARLHEAVFGAVMTDGQERDQVPMEFARRGGRDARPVLVIDEGEAPLGVPWELLYDARARYAAAVVDGSEPDPRHRQLPKAAGDVDLERFWGVRFAVRRVHRTKGRLPGLDLGRRVAAMVNADFSDVVVKNQADALRRPSPLPPHQRLIVDPYPQSPADIARWMTDGDVECDVLHLFCHAESATSFTSGGFPERAQVMDDSHFDFSDGEDGRVSLRDMRDARMRPMATAPLVLLNACSSGAVDGVFGAPFVEHFLDRWRCRAVMATNWAVPTVFGDRFSRGVLEHLDAGASLAAAMDSTSAEAFAVGNPYPLIYTVFGQPGVRVKVPD